MESARLAAIELIHESYSQRAPHKISFHWFAVKTVPQCTTVPNFPQAHRQASSIEHNSIASVLSYADTSKIPAKYEYVF